MQAAREGKRRCVEQSVHTFYISTSKSLRNSKQKEVAFCLGHKTEFNRARGWVDMVSTNPAISAVSALAEGTGNSEEELQTPWLFQGFRPPDQHLGRRKAAKLSGRKYQCLPGNYSFSLKKGEKLENAPEDSGLAPLN